MKKISLIITFLESRGQIQRGHWIERRPAWLSMWKHCDQIGVPHEWGGPKNSLKLLNSAAPKILNLRKYKARSKSHLLSLKNSGKFKMTDENVRRTYFLGISTVNFNLADTLCTMFVYCIFVYTGKKCVS